MAIKTWAAGAAGNWNVAGNWDPASVPEAGDDVVFDATSVHKCTLDVAAPALASLTASAAYTGGGADDGHFDLNGWDATVTGDVTLDNKQISLGSGKLLIGGNLDFADVATWNYETSEVELTATGGDKTIASPAGNYWDLKFYTFTINSGSNKVTWNSGDALACSRGFTVTGEFEISGSGRIYRATSPVDGVVINADSVISGTGTFLIHMISTTPVPTVNGRITCPFEYNVAQTHTGDVAACHYESDLTIHNSNAGDFTARIATGTLRVGGDFSVYHINLAGTATVDCDTNDPDLVFEGDVTIESDGSGSVTWTAGGGTITLQGTADQAVDFADKATENLTIDKATSGNVTLADADLTIDAIDLAGNLTVTSSALTATASTYTLGGNLDLSDGGNSFTAAGETWQFDGSGAQSINVGSLTLGSVTIDKSAGTLTQSSALSCAAFSHQAGTFDPNGKAITTTGNFTIAAGADIVAGTDAMNGAAWTVGGNFSAAGYAADVLNLQGTSSWTLTVTGTAAADHVTVAYSDASGGTAVLARSSTDGGNNQGWTFYVSGPYEVPLAAIGIAGPTKAHLQTAGG